MAGLDLRHELHSPHAEEETFDLEKLLGDLKEWTQEETEGKQTDAGAGPEENSIDIQRVSKDFQNLIDEYRPSVQVALNDCLLYTSPSPRDG